MDQWSNLQSMKGKLSPGQLSEKELKKWRAAFLANLKHWEREGELLGFLELLLTESEIIMCARRIEIAKLLLSGLSYAKIEERLGVGQKTVESVDRWLSQYREYRKVFPKALDARRRGDPNYLRASSFKALRHRFPLHFLIFNLILDDDE